MNPYLEAGLLIVLAVIGIVNIILLLKTKRSAENAAKDTDLEDLAAGLIQTEARLTQTVSLKTEGIGQTISAANQGVALQLQTLQQGLGESQRNLQKTVDDSQRNLRETVSESQSKLQQTVTDLRESVQTSVTAFQTANQTQLQNLSETVGTSMDKLKQTVSEEMNKTRTENDRQLSEIKKTVDEQLQDTLNKKLNESFNSVVTQLNNVQQGLGEMKTLATSVGDLKKALTQVKTRGIIGEIQLGAILDQILAPDQYETNVITVPGSRDPVEYAVKLPGQDEKAVWLPIDSKYPGDAYANLLAAYDAGDKAQIDACGKLLERKILEEAKDISEKYLHVPDTTAFGIMFLPIEGLYAEVVRRGLVERLQDTYKILIAGPTTLTALLNSLQMGFKTLAIQKKSEEVWKVLGNVKTEFGKYEEQVGRIQQNMKRVEDDFDKLVGTRTRAINRKLRDVEALSSSEGEDILQLAQYGPDEDEDDAPAGN